MTKETDHEEILIRLQDLRDQCERWHKHTESFFLNEEEQAVALLRFPPSSSVHYDGGYEGALKKKAVFSYDDEDGFSDIVCLVAEIDNRFRPIGHRDILGALMSLQIDRHTLGDFWIENDRRIVLYTTESMGRFICNELTKIGAHNVSFEMTDEHPIQIFKTREFEKVVGSTRADAIVASLANVSRSEAKRMIQTGKVQINHIVLENPDKNCADGSIISIRGVGRFMYVETLKTTRKDRIVALFRQNL